MTVVACHSSKVSLLFSQSQKAPSLKTVIKMDGEITTEEREKSKETGIAIYSMDEVEVNFDLCIKVTALYLFSFTLFGTGYTVVHVQYYSGVCDLMYIYSWHNINSDRNEINIALLTIEKYFNVILLSSYYIIEHKFSYQSYHA